MARSWTDCCGRLLPSCVATIFNATLNQSRLPKSETIVCKRQESTNVLIFVPTTDNARALGHEEGIHTPNLGYSCMWSVNLGHARLDGTQPLRIGPKVYARIPLSQFRMVH